MYTCIQVWKGIITVIRSWAKAFWKNETKIDLCQLECVGDASERDGGIPRRHRSRKVRAPGMVKGEV